MKAEDLHIEVIATYIVDLANELGVDDNVIVHALELACIKENQTHVVDRLFDIAQAVTNKRELDNDIPF